MLGIDHFLVGKHYSSVNPTLPIQRVSFEDFLPHSPQKKKKIIIGLLHNIAFCRQHDIKILLLV